MALKFVCALLTNPAVIGFFQKNLAYPLYVLGGGLYLGIQSSLFEIGLTLLAVLLWRQLGRDTDRAIGIGLGAGAFEAIMLGLAGLGGALVYYTGLPGAEQVKAGLDAAAAATPLFWLVAPAERAIAILCHAASRALVLLGTVKRRGAMVVWGFLLFTLLDAVAGGSQISGRIGQISLWWIELALLPFAAISIFIIGWCRRQWRETQCRDNSPSGSVSVSEDVTT